ncbi:hypothetical protein M9H77_09286 [Catharanthus roseus]|uniref:Uncharacterized protein n=1 Tax=Catharanthus roseus TaxID=4058 RepID=A0ACC0C0C0_CATRO|nr:hypothetical protein M9H77_09286 [Catharanthus roseus]
MDEMLSRFPDIFPYNIQHIDYYGISRHVPSYILRSGEHGGDENDVNVQGADLEDEAEHVHGEGEEEEDGSNTGKKEAKKGNDDSCMQRGPAPGGPRDPEILPSYDKHVAVAIWREKYGIPMIFIPVAGDDEDLPIDITALCYMLSVTRNSLFTDNSRLNVAWIYLYFPIFASPLGAGAVTRSPYIQQFELLGTTRGVSVLEYRMRLNTMRGG